jgi:biopolymer transport protein ExbD
MRLPEPPHRRQGEENLIPLINVVFLLLIFFMLAGFATPDLFRVDPPTSAVETPLEDQGHVLLLAADGRLALGEEALELDALPARLRALLESNPEARIKLKADAEVTSPLLLDTLDRLREAGVERIVLLAAKR